MRIVVFSDSHNSFGPLHRVVSEQPMADLFLHLGDGEPEFDDLRTLYPDKRMIFVKGNCDWASFASEQHLLSVFGRRIFFTHGHLYDVKRGVGLLVQKAKALGADIVCFGHTHLPQNEYAGGVYLLNPGSIGQPRAALPGYGVIDLSEAGIAPSLVSLQGGRS